MPPTSLSTGLSPIIVVHLAAALAAVLLGPVALWARRGPAPKQRPRLHRVAGRAWVVLMLVTALSALFIRGSALPHLGGFGPIHLLIPVVLVSLVHAFRQLRRGNVRGHRQTMLGLYIGSCLVAGAFTLLPGRLLGQIVWGQWLGLL